jgi:anti-sigma B factor antagonist
VAPASWALDPCPQASFALDEVHGCVVVVAAGEIDICTSPGLREALAEAVQRSDRAIIDLTRVGFLDSTGMAVMVEGFRNEQLGQDGALCLVGPTGVVARALDVTGLTTMFRIYPSVEQAAGAVA